MKAAVFVDRQNIQIRELDHICHGDITKNIQPPVVLGHEIAGVIETVGVDVKHLRTGQNVCVDPVIGCGSCPYCHMARPNLCQAPTIIGYVLNGGFAQYLVAPATNIYPLKPDTPPAAGILCETLACVLNGYDKLDLKPGRNALVIGAGTVGLLWNQLLRRSPVTLLVQSEPVEMRRQRAGQLGADLVVDPHNQNLSDEIRKVAPDGFDYVIDASGNPQAVEEGIKLVANSGTFLIFGVCPAETAININPHEIYQKEMRIMGSKMPPYSLQRAVEMIMAGLIDHQAVVTGTFGLVNLPRAIDMFESDRDTHIKMAIDPWKE